MCLFRNVFKTFPTETLAFNLVIFKKYIFRQTLTEYYTNIRYFLPF